MSAETQSSDLTPSKQSCGTCRFARRGGGIRWCHRNPPPWPPVADHEWCGEYAVGQIVLANEDGVKELPL